MISPVLGFTYLSLDGSDEEPLGIYLIQEYCTLSGSKSS
jgi:hypothetical protein